VADRKLSNQSGKSTVDSQSNAQAGIHERVGVMDNVLGAIGGTPLLGLHKSVQNLAATVLPNPRPQAFLHQAPILWPSASRL